MHHTGSQESTPVEIPEELEGEVPQGVPVEEELKEEVP
jgi:hypothetical protein